MSKRIPLVFPFLMSSVWILDGLFAIRIAWCSGRDLNRGVGYKLGAVSLFLHSVHQRIGLDTYIMVLDTVLYNSNNNGDKNWQNAIDTFSFFD